MTTFTPASQKQVSFIESLLSDRECEAGLARNIRGELPHMDSHTASQWINTLLARPKLPAPTGPKEVVNFDGLRGLFAKASQNLKRPRIVLDLNGDALTVKLMTTGGHVGSINFSTGTFEEGTWYGRVETNGELTASRKMTAQVRELIAELSVDPVAAAKRHAHLTGNCCFCNRKLDDERSTAAGYGPICAGNYGLPWGEA
jgi:hypothetical protein